MMAADRIAVEAARLLGGDRSLRRATDNDLAVEAEYRLRAARECLALDPPSPELCAFHEAALGSIRAEIERRLAYGAPRRGKGMTRADVERIRDAAPCQEVVEWLRLSDLKPAGRERWVGLCPFHAERTPSFSVWPSHYVCFGCGAKGDVFALVTQVLDLRVVSMAGLAMGGVGDSTFRDAVRVLADYAGLPDPTAPPKPLPRVVGG